MAVSEQNYLVPGRECGTCTACCTELTIVGGGIDKLATMPCRNLVGGNCTVYASRPTLCREFNCLWRSLDNAGEEWRPDRSGILMRLSDEPADNGAFAVGLMLYGSPEVLATDGFAGLVAGSSRAAPSPTCSCRQGPAW